MEEQVHLLLRVLLAVLILMLPAVQAPRKETVMEEDNPPVEAPPEVGTLEDRDRENNGGKREA